MLSKRVFSISLKKPLKNKAKLSSQLVESFNLSIKFICNFRATTFFKNINNKNINAVNLQIIIKKEQGK